MSPARISFRSRLGRRLFALLGRTAPLAWCRRGIRRVDGGRRDRAGRRICGSGGNSSHRCRQEGRQLSGNRCRLGLDPRRTILADALHPWLVVTVAFLTGTIIARTIIARTILPWPVIPRTLVTTTFETRWTGLKPIGRAFAAPFRAVAIGAIALRPIALWPFALRPVCLWPLRLRTFEPAIVAVAILPVPVRTLEPALAGTILPRTILPRAILALSVLTAILFEAALGLLAILCVVTAFGRSPCARLRRMGGIDIVVAVFIAILVRIVLAERPLRLVAVAELRAHLLMGSQHDPHIVLCVLIVIFGRNRVAARVRIPSQLHVLLGDGLGVAAHLDVRSIGLERPGQRVGCLVVAAPAPAIVAVAAPHAPVLAWSHR
jgi:hypothetical protein